MAAINGSNTVTDFKYITPPEAWSLGIALPLVTTIIVGLRFQTRWTQKLKIGVDDWLILGAAITFVGVGICFIIGSAKHVFGFTTPSLPADLTTNDEVLNYLEPAVELVGKLEFAIQLLTVVCYGFIKLSILTFYRGVFVVKRFSTFDRILLGSSVVIFLWTVAFVLIVIFPCGVHVDNNWGTAAQQIAHCLAIGYSSLDGLAASDFILDLWVICLPLPMIWKLHMERTQKFAVTGIMLLGATALGASIARLVLYVRTQAAAEAFVTVDFDEEITLQMYWSSLECGLAIIAACLPKLSYMANKFSMQLTVRNARSMLSLRYANNPQASASERQSRNQHDDIESGSKASGSLESNSIALQSMQVDHPTKLHVGDIADADFGR